MSSSDPNEQQQQLQESFLQQQEKISALKELVRKSGAAHGSSKSAAQEKVKNIAEILMKSKAKSRQGLNVSTYSTESTSRDVSFLAQDQNNMLSLSQGQFPQQTQSPAPSFASTPNPTPSKPQAGKLMETPSSYGSNFSTPGSEKIALMRQQLEQNKLRMAQKASSKQHLEQLVSQLKEKFDSTQQCLEDTTELGRSMSDLSNLIQYTPVSRERHKSATDLTTQNFNLERERIKFLENRCRLLEKQLEKEKQNNQRNTSANISSSNSDRLEAKVNELELLLQEKQKEFEEREKELREELRKLQNSREITDFEASEENSKLLKENEELKLEIVGLSQDFNSTNVQEEIKIITKENSQLKKEVENLSKKLEIFASGQQQSTAPSAESVDLLKQIDDLKNQLQSVSSNESSESLDLLNENQLLKQETETQLKRIHELNEINDVLETTRCDLTSKCTELQANLIVAQEKLRLSEEKCEQLMDSTKTSHPKDTDSLVKSEMAKQIQELMDEIGEIRSENSKLKESLDDKEKLEINDSSIAEKIANLEACIENQREDLLKSQELRNKFEEELMEKTIELNVLNANFKVMEEKLESSAKTKPLFSSTSASQHDSNNTELELENQQLKTKLDESNKAMIKLKLKCKQTEKQIEKLKKGSDLHGEVVKLTKEKDQLQQKITELEDEKGQWQLIQMETSQGSNKEEEIKENLNKEWQEKVEALEAALKEKETLLVTLKQGEQSRVTSELGEIQLEEQVKELNQEVTSLVLDLEYKDKALQTALENFDKILKEKDDLDKKLERYVNENMELLEKVEKLSKSSSSAESIEIVERLTQQEKQELEEFNNRLGDSTDESPIQKEAVNELTQTEMNPEITDSLNKLREESSELQTKIELFTTERREVLEKMEHLNTENHDLLQRIENLQQEKEEMESKLGKHLEKHDQLQNQLKAIQKEKDSLSTQMQEYKSQRNQLSQDITSLQQSSEVVASLDNSETLFEKCETSLLKLHGELEAYRKANDKKSKFNVSKKLAKEAENAYSQLTELLQKVKEASNAVETVTVVETVVAVTASNGKALAEYEQLTASNRELKATIQELRRLYEEAREFNEDQTDKRFSSVEQTAAIKSEEDNENDMKLRDALQQVEEYELQLNTLQSRVEDLSQDLYEARTGLTEKSDEISQLSEELNGHKKLTEDFRLIKDKEMANEKQLDQLNRLRKELESKVNNYEHEIQILQTLVKEQKQQLIEAYQEHEHEMNVKLLEIQNKDQTSLELKQEIQQLKDTCALQGSELTQDLQKECEKLRESLKINKNLVQQQVEELSNKQETIDTLNQQIIDLYKTMEDNANKIIEKEDEITYLQELMDSNKQELTKLELKLKELMKTNQNLEHLNKQQKEELNEQLEQLLIVPILEKKTQDLEQRNKDQLEKLKKYAANLKKKANQCLEYEQKLKQLATQPSTPTNSQELEELNNKNSQLQDLLNKTQQNLQQKAQELEEVLQIKSSLDNEILQLKQEVTNKQLALETQEQEATGWGDNSELETLQEELMLMREQLTAKHQEIEELRQSLTTAQSVIENQQTQLFGANNLRAELQADHNQIEKLQNDILQTQQKTVDWGTSSDTEFKHEAQQANKMVEKLQHDLITAQKQTSDWGDTSETEKLRLKLQNAHISIHKLQTDLLEAQQQSSDWGDSNELEQLRQDLQEAQLTIQNLQTELLAAQQQTSDWGNDSNETEQLREELLCSQENFALKTREIEELRQSLMAAQEQLTVWGNETSVKNTDYENLTKVMAEKTAKLEKAESTLDELENDLMTLREKEQENSQKLQELTKELEDLKSKPTPIEHQQQPLEQKLLEVTAELKAKAIKFEKSKAVIKERNGQIQRLQLKLKDLQEKLTSCPEEEILSPSTQHQLDASVQQPVRAELEALKEAYAKLNDKYNSDKANFQETTKRLETLHDGIQAKLQEDMSYIETLEQENLKFKNKICRLEECVGCFEERRASMERRVNFMDAQLQSESEEHTKAEDELIYRLNMLSNHDEVIAQRLIDSQSEKEEIEENFRKLQTEYNVIQTQYQKLEKEFIEYKDETSNDYEQELTSLRELISKSEVDMERQKAVYDGKLAAKVTELDELECELSEQLSSINSEKRQLMERLERMTDECAAHQNDVLRLQENVNTLEQAKSELERESSWLRMQTENSQQDLYELQELRMQCMQDKTEIENLRHQIDSLSSNHESELQALRTQIAELDTLRMQVGQNQTDDQVFIETENKRLTDLLAEKEAVIENYQRQNLQLQMAAAAASTSASNQPDPFALAFGLPPQTSSNQQMPANSDNNANELERLNQEMQDKTNLIYRLQQDLNNLQTEFNTVLEANQEMQRQLNERQLDNVNRQTLQSVATALTEHQPTDVIPAPPMFFTSEAAVRTPFDDLIQPSHSGEQPSTQAMQEQSPTIEDLQRNVSDLEKHAQDLEHKLAGRNQREFENEERFREFETRYHEREQQLQQTLAELQKLQADYAALQMQQTELVALQQQQFEYQTMQQQLHDLRNQVEFLEDSLQERDQELHRLKSERLEEEHLKKTMPSLEQQIVPAMDTAVLPTLDMFFGTSSAPEFEVFSIPQQSMEPVEEEIIVPKKSYLCHPKEAPIANTQDTTLTTLDLGEDWGDSWGNSEAAAEAEHFAKQSAATTSAQPPSLVPREQQLELQMQDLNERLQELQLSLERSEEQKKELHVKSGKLMKKLKEYKVKIDELQSTTSNSANDHRKSSSVESNSMFADLDAAIEEELKRQIKSLEDKLEEQKKQQDSYNMEKEKMLARIDMLTAGNDRMSDMKERQDMEVQMYQARIRELQEKLTNLSDWGNEDDTTKEPAPNTADQIPLGNQGDSKTNTSPNLVKELEQQVVSLTFEVQDLSGDRLELQALLEEEKVNSAKAEQTLAALRLQLQTLEDNQTGERSDETYQLNNLKIDLQNSQESYNNLQALNEKLSQDLKNQAETLLLSQSNESRLQLEVDALQKEVNNLRETQNNTIQSLIDLDTELTALKEQKEKQIDEERNREKKNSLDMIQLIESQKQDLEKQANELRKENEELKSKHTDQQDLQDLVAEIEYLKNNASSSNNTTELSALLQERESEILHLKQRINDLMNEDQTEKLVLEILTKNQEIHMLKMQVKHLEDDKHELENNLSLQITKEMQNNKEETQQTSTVDNNTTPVSSQIQELLAEKKQMEEELQVLNNHVLESLHLEEEMKALTLELDTKNIEISELRKTVESIKSSSTATNSETSIDLVNLNAQWEAIVEQRCGEIAKMWQEHLSQRERDFKNIEDRLHDEIEALQKNQSANLNILTQPQVISVETTSSSTPVSESTTNSASTSNAASQEGTPLRIRSEDTEANADDIIEKMQAALESQEMEIVTLKEQLAIRSAEYARLAAQYDPFKLHNTSSHSSAASPSDARRPTIPALSEVPMVAKAELDLAMYMLHQRDMRCEEMTLELVNLLEERDTLQLKLSNTLRQVEAIKTQTGGLHDASLLAGAASLSSTSENLLNTSVAGSTGGNSDDDLNQKLSQLQTVSHSKDKVIKEEREQRLRQMEMLQQDVAKMPTAAVSELIGSDLSQSNQSPSNVLLNWLWGNKGNGGGPQPGF